MPGRESIFLKQNIVTRDRILILISGFFYFASPMLVTPLITGFSENLGASAALMGVIGGLMNICSLFCRPFVGNLTDKISKYKLSFIGAVLMAAASVGYAAAQSPLFIVAARIVNGIGFSLCSVCISTWMSTLLPKEKIGSGMGIYGAMNALAMAAAPAVGVSLYERIGYRPAFLVAAAFSILIVVVIQFVQNKGEPVSVASVYKGLKSTLHRPCCPLYTDAIERRKRKSGKKKSTGCGKEGAPYCIYYYAVCDTVLCNPVFLTAVRFPFL